MTEVTLEQAEERETIDGKKHNSFFPQNTDTSRHSRGDNKAHAHTALTLQTWCVAPNFSLKFTSAIFLCFYMYIQRSWENDYWHSERRRELVAFSLLSPLSINLQFIFSTRDMESRHVWFSGLLTK